MANKSGFNIGDRIIIHGFKNDNCMEGKTGTVVNFSDHLCIYGEYGAVARLDDGVGCCDVNGCQSALPQDCIVIRNKVNAQLINSKPVDIEELI